MATLSALELMVQLLEEDLFSEMDKVVHVEKKDEDLIIGQGEVINSNKGDDSFDRILREEDSGPDPNTIALNGPSSAPSDSHKSIQDILLTASTQLSSMVQALATVKANMTDFFSK